MRRLDALEYPEDVERVYRVARRWQWVTLAYVSSAAVLLYLTMGTSQAMRSSFYEDVISLVPSAAFLIGTAIARRAPTRTYPFGAHRATSIAHLVAAVALCGMGLFLLGEAAMKAISGDKPTIGGVAVFGSVIWGGWLMLAAVAYSTIPSFVLGRKKLRLAPKIHDKVLFADAQMMKADWMAEAATAIGVVGTGFGLWWLDPLAAAIVSADILKDGISNLRTAVADLADRRPRRTDNSEWEKLPGEVEGMLRELPWVAAAEVRMREAGHIFIGDALVVPRPGTQDLVDKLGDAAAQAKSLDWRIHELVLMPVLSLGNGRSATDRAAPSEGRLT